jgi:hypothetical protein
VQGQPEKQQHKGMKEMILKLDTWIKELDNIPVCPDNAKIKTMLLWQQIPSPHSYADFSPPYITGWRISKIQ